MTDFGTTRYICNNDSGTTRYICSNKNFFFDYTLTREGEEVIYLSDSWSTLVLSNGKILHKLTFRKNLSLNIVLHVPYIKYNLVSIYMLGKARLKVSFEGDKIVITKIIMFVRKGYCFRELFKLKVFNVIMNETNFSSAYIVDCIHLWHRRFGHMNFFYTKKTKELGLLSNLGLSNDKCKVCVES